jgi:cysteine-rich repeat protein
MPGRLGRFLFLLLGLGDAVVAGTPASAELAPAGSEFAVNAYTTNTQAQPSVCRAADGDFVVSWFSDGIDGSGTGIVARRFASDGTPQGTEFQVNTYTTDDQYDTSVCCDTAGAFVVTWERRDPNDGGLDVFARRFASDGTPRGDEFRVNTYTTTDQVDARICCDATGGFVVGWEDDLDGDSIAARRFASDGTPHGSQFQVNTYTTGEARNAAIACTGDGAFAVAWEFPGDGSTDGVFVRRYASDGMPAGAEFQVNTYTTSYQERASLCLSDVGEMVVTWESYAQDGDNNGVFGRRFTRAGAPAGDEFAVSTYTFLNQQQSRVACDATGGFTVVWESYPPGGPPATDVFGRRYAAGGTPLGTEFRANTYTTGSQFDAAIAADPEGDFVVVWDRAGDGSGYGVFGQRFVDPCGDGTVDAGEQCDDGSRNAGVCCSASCQNAAAGTACEDDGVGCTTDACTAGGTCGHTLVLAACPSCQVCDAGLGCVTRRRGDCRRPTKNDKAALTLADKSNDRRDTVSFAWQKGAATALADLGTPTAAGDWAFCVFDTAGGADRLVLQSTIPAGNGWRARGRRGFRFRNRRGTPDGITRVDATPGKAGKASILVQGKGPNLLMPPLGLGAPVEAQLETSGRGPCFAATFATPKTNTSALFRARGR